MTKGRSNQLIKQIGEYLVASELARQGFIVATFSGNVPDFDLIATSTVGRSCPIQVKSIKGGSWQFSIDKFVDITLEGDKQIVGDKKPLEIPNLICVFVITASNYGQDEFFIVEWSEVQNILIENHTKWLSKHGGIRPRKPDSMHCALHKENLEKFKNNWFLIHSQI